MTTIFAKASGEGRSGVAIYRISGSLAGWALEQLTGSRGKARFARRVDVQDAEGGLIDDGLALWFPGPASFTGEDCAELQLHGSPAVELQVSRALVALGLEPAGPGAFTMRAFSNGKMDLTQAEGLADLLAAETSLQHRQAMASYSGKLRDAADGWRSDLIEAMAKLDASVDFPDEEDVPSAIAAGALPAVERVRGSVSSTLAGVAAAQRIKSGVKVALVGPPNAGKSSLFNKIVEEEWAIVSAEAGTTRDVISETVALGGHRVTFLDTAGVRDEVGSEIEAAGISLTRKVAEQADMRLLCYPAAAGTLPSWMLDLRSKNDLIVRTKSDLGLGVGDVSAALSDEVSLKTLREAILDRLGELASPGLAPSVRQEGLLRSVLDGLTGFEEAAVVAPEIGAEVVRQAAAKLEELTGRIAPDDVLGDIFSSFCIGK